MNCGHVLLARFPHPSGGRGKKRPVVVVQAEIHRGAAKRAQSCLLGPSRWINLDGHFRPFGKRLRLIQHDLAVDDGSFEGHGCVARSKNVVMESNRVGAGPSAPTTVTPRWNSNAGCKGVVRRGATPSHLQINESRALFPHLPYNH